MGGILEWGGGGEGLIQKGGGTTPITNYVFNQIIVLFSKCLWPVFALLSFENLKLCIWGVIVWLLILQHMNKKLENKGHQIYSKMLRKICKIKV